ncbi:MAG: hypothetical protein ACE14M_14535 [Terriglobales bacterium]
MSAAHTIEAQMPTDILELKAAEQRRRLHDSVAELRSAVREKLDVKHTAREYLVPASIGAAVVGLVFGYGMGGMFTR